MTTRLHRRIFGPLWPMPLPDITHLYSSATVSDIARRVLQHQLSAPGQWRSGPIFGKAADDVLHIHAVAPGSYRIWRDPILEGSHAYQLGVIDALQAYVQPDIDWVGSWFTRPDNLLPSYTDSGSGEELPLAFSTMQACSSPSGYRTTAFTWTAISS